MKMLNGNTGYDLQVGRALQQWIRDIRRHLHSYPELSFKEESTSAFIKSKLEEIGVSNIKTVEKTGVVAQLDSEDDSRMGVALRADMDALPVIEETGLSFSSLNHGIMHACGHDGHMAMLLGAAALLKRNALAAPVKLLFQPGEERGNGAEKMVQNGVLENTAMIFGGHIDTHFSVGTFTIDEGIICAWADPFIIRLRGRSGHAARPHEAVDSIVAAANLVMSAQTLISRGVDPNRSAVVTIGSVDAGSAQNIIAQDAVLRGTVRCTHAETRKKTLTGLRRMVRTIGDMYEVDSSITFRDIVPAVENHSDAVALAIKAASCVNGVQRVTSQGPPSLGAEDFAFYQEEIPGCLIRYGAAKDETAGVSHSRTFDFHEDVLAMGAGWLAQVALTWLWETYSTKESIDE